MIIQVAQPFSFTECLHFLGRSAHECLHHATGSHVRKLLKVNEEYVLFELSSDGKGQLQVSFLNGTPSKPAADGVKTYIADWFDLQTDISPFYDLALTDPVLQSLTEKYQGLRLIGIPDLFEALSWSVIGQQINLKFAYTLKARYVAHFGESYTYDGQQYYLHPKPEVIAKLEVEDFISLQFNRKKAEYLIEIAKQMTSGKLEKSQLQKLDFKSAHAQLTNIRGIGNWTASYVLMKCLKQPDAFPIEDVGLHNAIKYQLELDTKPSLTEIHDLAQNWDGWKAYATFYLWRSLIKHE
jgi:DNA-3-methyladenine glycosylase II